MRGHFKWVLWLSSLASVCLLSGCAIISQGRMQGIKPEQIEVIKIGSSTEQDIIDKFGKPQQIIQKPSDVKVYIYSHGVEKSIGIPFIISVARTSGSGQRLSIYFQNGIVSDYEYMTDNRSVT